MTSSTDESSPSPPSKSAPPEPKVVQSAMMFPLNLIQISYWYYAGFFHYYSGGKAFRCGSDCALSFLRPKDGDSLERKLFKQHANIHLYTLALVFYLYDKPHYRKSSYGRDLVDNLCNVAVPGTGIPLSWFVLTKFTTFWTILLAPPVLSFLAALNFAFQSRNEQHPAYSPHSSPGTVLVEEFATRLLAPDDWFSFWRINCRVAAMHALAYDNALPGYEMENKWTFLEEGRKRGVPVSPYLDVPALVIKHRNEEGGLGIHFFKNATHGGDWIIQKRIFNSHWVAHHLPPNSPLSTFRVITQSRASLNLDTKTPPSADDVVALSCVFRAGRANALTDHDSILFDVHTQTGQVRGGTTNAHWYRLGWYQCLPGGCPWRSYDESRLTHHPDGHLAVTGSVVPDMAQMLQLVESSHAKLCPDVPLVGWDVVLSDDPQLPRCLLEVNLSCNFFRGTFDRQVYFDFLDDMLTLLHHKREKIHKSPGATTTTTTTTTTAASSLPSQQPTIQTKKKE